MFGPRIVPTLLLLCCSAAILRGEDPPALTDGGVPATFTLKQQLEKGLKARRPVEFQYIASIVKLVEAGQLPKSLVYSTFDWARKKRTKKIQYFQFALAAQAKDINIALPSLDAQLADEASTADSTSQLPQQAQP